MLRQVVVEGGPGTRRSGRGLYEMMHAVEDSFSGSHTQRRPDTLAIEELRVWAPLTHLPGLAPERTARIPDSAYHKWDDHRDKTYVVEDRVVAGGRRCKDLTDSPYAVPFECLSEEGNSARRPSSSCSSSSGTSTPRGSRRRRMPPPLPEQSEAWLAYKAKWFAPAYACEGAECLERQPPDLAPGAYGFVGLGTTYNETRRYFDATATGALLKYSSTLNPFVYALAGEVGYRSYADGAGAGLVGLELDLILPLGKHASLGFVPAEWRLVFAKDQVASELSTEFLRFDYLLSKRMALTFRGPLEINWRKPAAELSFGVGLSYALTAPALSGDSLVEHTEKTERVDEAAWSPPQAPYGRLQGRRPSWYVGTGATTVETPAVVSEGRTYGTGSIDGLVLWDRDRWGGRFAWAPGASLAIGARATSGESAYITGAFGVDLRWYALGVLGLSLTPVRIEGGPKIRGGSELDTSPGVHGPEGSQYYFQAGSRVGIAFNAGIVDILVQGPTIAWSSTPFASHEILSVALSIRLN